MIPNALVMRKEGRRKLTQVNCNAKRNDNEAISCINALREKELRKKLSETLIKKLKRNLMMEVSDIDYKIEKVK